MMTRALPDDFNLTVFGLIVAVTSLNATLMGFYAPTLLPYLILAVAVLFALARPEYAYFSFIAVLPVHSYLLTPLYDQYKSILPSDIMLIFVVVSWVISRLAGTAKPYPGSSCDWLWIFFYCWVALSLSWTPNPGQGLYEMIKLFGCMSAFVVTLSLLTSFRMLKYVLNIYIATGLLTSLVSIGSVYSHYGVFKKIPIGYQWSFLNSLWLKHMGHLTYFVVPRGEAFGVPHTTALYINIALFFAIAFLLVEKSKKGRILWSVAVIILATGMLSTLTKSAIGSVWVGVAFLFVHLHRLKNWLVTSLGVVVLLTIVLFVLARLPEVSGSIRYTAAQLDNSKPGSSVSDRVTLWKKGLKKLVQTDGRGYGAGGFVRKGPMPVPDGTHPAILFDYGIIGLFLWCFVFLKALVEFYAHLKTIVSEFYRRIYLAYLSGYVMMLVIWTVTLHYDYVDLYLYLAIGYVLTRLSRQEAFADSIVTFDQKAESLVNVPCYCSKT